MRDFNHTVNVLVQSYMNNTLCHNNCYACAVGNLIADANCFKYEVLKNPFGNDPDFILKWNSMDSIYERYSGLTAGNQDGNWMAVFGGGLKIKLNKYIGKTKLFIDNTGYTLDELDAIEQAFEGVEYNGEPDQYMFNGLMAVVDVLADIHGIDLQAKESAKLLFVKA